MSLNLAPMVDVMMCLIIFFMLASKMVERENSPVLLPAASTAQEADKRELGRRVVVNVMVDSSAASPSAEPASGYAPTTARYAIEQQTVSLADVARRLTAEHQRDPAVRCVIRGDRELPYHTVEAVLLACAQAGIENVVFGALTREQE